MAGLEDAHDAEPRQTRAMRRIEFVGRVLATSSLLLAVTLAVLVAVSTQDFRSGGDALLQADALIKEASKEAAELRLLTHAHAKGKKGADQPARQDQLATALEKSSESAERGLRKKIEVSTAKTKLEHMRAEEQAKAEEKAEMASHCIFCTKPKKTREEAAQEDLALRKMSQITAKSKEERIEKTRKLTSEDKAKINAAALKIAAGMQPDNPGMSAGVQREMARIHKSGTSWNALWGDASSLSGENRAKFQYLAGKPRAFSTGGDAGLDLGLGDEDDDEARSRGDSDPVSFSKDPFGSNFHY